MSLKENIQSNKSKKKNCKQPNKKNAEKSYSYRALNTMCCAL